MNEAADHLFEGYGYECDACGKTRDDHPMVLWTGTGVPWERHGWDALDHAAKVIGYAIGTIAIAYVGFLVLGAIITR